VTKSTLKGTVSQDFRPLDFFYQTILTGPLIHELFAFLNSALNSLIYDQLMQAKITRKIFIR
jgi:hypothetical protein